MVTWITQSSGLFADRCSEVSEAIRKRCKETNHTWLELDIIPFSHEVVGGLPEVVSPAVMYGSTNIRAVAKQMTAEPLVWDYSGVKESVVSAALGNKYLNSDMIICKAEEADNIAEQQGWELFFAKPNTDNKEFAGTVFDTKRYSYFIEGVFAQEWIPRDFEVVVSSVKNTNIEWRLIVVDSKIVEYTIYKQWQTIMSSREIYQEVLDFAHDCINIHNPGDVYTIDIAETDKGLAVVEYNGFNSAGLYACDVNNIVDANNDFLTKGT